MAQVESAPPSTSFDPQGKEDEEGYTSLLVRVSLLLVRKDFPLDVQRDGAKMLQHLLKFREEELSTTDIFHLTVELVGSPNEEYASSKTENPGGQNRHSSLLMLAANNLRSLDAEETGGVQNESERSVDAVTSFKPMSCPRIRFLSLGQRPFALGCGRIDFSTAIDPNFLSSPTSLSALVPIPHLEGAIAPHAYIAPSSSKSVLSRALSLQYGKSSTHKQQCCSLPRGRILHSLPFPVDSPVPIAYFGLGTKAKFVNAQRRLIYRLEPDGSSHSSSSDQSGSSSESHNTCSNESSSSDNLSCKRSFGLPFDTQVDCDESELEIQRLMAIDISDYDEVNSYPKDQGGKQIGDVVYPQMLMFDGKLHIHQVQGCLLLAEHNILCHAFCITSCSRNHRHKSVLPCIINLLNIIWTQPEWESTFLCSGRGLSCLFADGHFLKTTYNIVKFFEDELKRSIGEEFAERQSDDNYFIALLRLVLPLLLKLLRCIHTLWKGRIACNLSQELQRAKTLMDDEEASQQNETRELLEKIRESGYNLLGLCMYLEGAFVELLDSSSLTVAFGDLGSMEFRHLSKLIHLVFFPLVRNCPREFWKEWMLELLRPLLRLCEDVLYSAWFSLMHRGRAKVAYYFGKLAGSAEDIEKLEHSLLLEFTRAVCHLLGNISSPESNSGLFCDYFEDASSKKIATFQDLESISSNSLLGYLLLHDCFGSLRMGLFGYWVDGEATRKAIPFCHALLWLAGVTNDGRLRLFVMNELLPSLIRRIDGQLSCAVRHLICKLSSSITDDVDEELVMLCRELYSYVSNNVDAQSLDIVGEHNAIESDADSFTCWLARHKKDLSTKACCAVPGEFDGLKAEWNWEFEDEFRRHLPLYMDMLKEVDAIEDSKSDYSDWEILDKLNPEFRSKYAINSIDHPHFRPISYMRRRKFDSMAQVRNHKHMSAFLSKLITLKPYIKGSDHFYSVVNRLQKDSEIPTSISDSCDVEESIHVLLNSILFLWEPQFHPLIREGHKDLLLRIIDQLSKGKEFEDFQPLAPDPEDFPTHLKPYAMMYIMTKLKAEMYARAEEQLLLHEDYDNYLASGDLDSYICASVSFEDDLSAIDVATCAVPSKFSNLDPDLIKLSLKRRAAVVQIHHQVRTYSDCLRGLHANELLKGRLEKLMTEFEQEGFFDVNNDCIDWKKQRFTALIDRFKDEVFEGLSLPRYYIIRGIIDCRLILLQKDTLLAFKQVVDEVCNRLIAYLPQFWRDTRHYEHYFCDVVREPLQKIFV
ncbi:hypothetical protein ACP70R_002678 [Stipagrostis hirtigluma subsp. patula]